MGVRDGASFHVHVTPGVLLPLNIALRPRGRFRLITLDPRTGRERVQGELVNAYTADGLNFLAAALAGGPKLNPANGALRCRVNGRTLDGSGSPTGATALRHTFTTGPLTSGAQYQAPQLTSMANAGTSAWLPVRLRWSTPTEDLPNAYSLDTLDLLNGSTVLAAAEAIGGNLVKRAGEVSIIEYQFDLTGSGDGPAAAHAIEAIIGGATSVPFTGYVRDRRSSDGTQTYRQGAVGNPTSQGAVATIAGTWDPATVAGSYTRSEFEADRWEVRLAGLYDPPMDGQPREDGILLQTDFSPRLAIPAQGLMTFSATLTFSA